MGEGRAKKEWPGFIAAELGIKPVQGKVAPFVTTGDTTLAIWFREVCAVLELEYPGSRDESAGVLHQVL